MISRFNLFHLTVLVALALCAAVQSARSQTAEQFRTYIVQWEGYTTHPIHRGHETVVGYGHNCAFDLERPLHSTYGRTELLRLYRADYLHALSAARAGITSFDTLPFQTRLTILSVVWTIGPTGFRRFTHFRSDLSERHYSLAAADLSTSLWTQQVGPTRSTDHIGVIGDSR